MKLYIMKREALEMLKANLPTIYGKYYTEKTNHWISDIYGENPFIELLRSISPGVKSELKMFQSSI